MQFLPTTWDTYGLDANDDGYADICDYRDAIPSAAYYLTDHYGGGDDDPGGYSWPTSSYGDQAEAVHSIQYLLEQHGYSLNYHDGIVGPDTWQALMALWPGATPSRKTATPGQRRPHPKT